MYLTSPVPLASRARLRMTVVALVMAVLARWNIKDSLIQELVVIMSPGATEEEIVTWRYPAAGISTVKRNAMHRVLA